MSGCVVREARPVMVSWRVSAGRGYETSPQTVPLAYITCLCTNFPTISRYTLIVVERAQNSCPVLSKCSTVLESYIVCGR